MYTRKVATTATPKRKKLVGNTNNLNEIASEHDLQKACVAKLRAHNMICSCTDVFNAISFIKDVPGKAIYKQHMIKMGGAIGFPDLIIIHKGKATFVEFKWKKGKKSPEQIVWTEILQNQGYEVLEWRTLQDCIDWLLKVVDLNKDSKENASI